MRHRVRRLILHPASRILYLAALPLVVSPSAQGAERRQVVVKVPLANLRAQPSSVAAIVVQVPEGTVLEVLEDRGQWLKVQYRHPERGPLQGYIAARLVEPVLPAAPLPPKPPERPAERPPPPPTPPLKPTPPSPPTRRPPSERYWEFRVLAGLNPGVADGYDQTVTDQLFIYFEPAPLNGRYRAELAPIVGLGVEYRWKPRLGVGLEGDFMLGRTSADLTVQVPHPLYFGIQRGTTANDVGDFSYRKLGGTLYMAYYPSEPSASLRFSVLAGAAVHVMQFESITGLEIQESAYPYDDPPSVTGVTQASKSGLVFGGFIGLG
ncbi:MAG: SH3 domain-containing protein, partial [Acidobacteria bacterium]|nr:SH3 domain-containing protein [Acidobacteriota bacterium]MDW7985476.1 SH3 domain-containing protein [Acidobacteriota bacterium]